LYSGSIDAEARYIRYLRGKNKQTPRSRDDQKRADDLVKRDFSADQPWIADLALL